jgi:uncharacterized membrane protein
MDAEDWIVPLLLIAVLAVILSWRSLVLAGRLRRQLDALIEKFRMVEHRMIRLNERLSGAMVEASPEAEAPAGSGPPAETEPARIAAQVEAAPPRPERETEPAMAQPVAAPVARPEAPAPATARPWEQVLTENWLVWLGGVTLALGGAFLVKLSIDYGLLTPPVRVLLAGLLGVALAIGGDRLARRELAAEPKSSGVSYVPQALAAAGAAIVFASIYAAYQLYGLIGPGLALPLLAATAIATALMSLRQGPLVAALGLVGAYAVPLLVASDEPRALPLFGYLVSVTAGSLILLRHRGWWWLAWLSLAGAVLWAMLWLAAQPTQPETGIVALYLLALLGLFAGFRRGVPRIGFLAGLGASPIVRILTRVAVWAIAVAMFALVHVDDFAEISLGAALAMAIFTIWLAARDAELDDLIAVAGVLLLAVLASWKLPFPSSEDVLLLYVRPPAQIAHFSAAAGIAAILLGAVPFAMLARVVHPGRWAALSAAAPVLILIIAYWRLHSLGIDIGWTAAGLGLAVIELAAAARVAGSRTDETRLELEIAVSAYAVGVLSGTILAATFALSTAWLSVALAVHLPAMGWIEGRTRVPALRWLAAGVAIAVLVRLALNPYVLEYPLSATPIFNWLLYGYGIPALAFIVATRQFGSRTDDLLVGLLEAGSVVFVTLLLTLELRHALYGRIAAPYGDLGRDATSVLVWLSLSGFALWLGERRRRPVLHVAGVILFVLATAQAVLWQALIANPLITGEKVGRILVFDTLSMAYALPALCYAAMVWLRLGPGELRWAARILAAGFAFLWLSLEVRHAFRGEVLTWGTAGETEWYAYSAAWLVFAGIGLAVGLVRRNDWLRRAALIGIGLVILKVFVSDMAALSGVLRALSFLGLGGALIGIGYAYRKLQPLKPAGENEAPRQAT